MGSRVAGQLTNLPPLLWAHINPGLPRGSPSVRRPGCPLGNRRPRKCANQEQRGPSEKLFALSRCVSGLRPLRAGPRPAAQLCGRGESAGPWLSRSLSGHPPLPFLGDSQMRPFAALLPSTSLVLKPEVTGHRQNKPMPPSGVAPALQLALGRLFGGTVLGRCFSFTLYRSPVGQMTTESQA